MSTDLGNAAGAAQETATIRKKVAALSVPAAYPGAVHEVQIRETHMSWVFLAGERVYKLKKPVRYAFLDFSTLAAREADCRAEVRLNRRLAPDIYLGVVALTQEADGTLTLGGGGETVDWLVMMRRLPEERMLDAAIARQSVTRRDIAQVADTLAGFYRGLKPASVSAHDHVARFAREQAHNRAILTDRRFDLPAATRGRVLQGIEAIIEDEPELLMARVRHGRIVDGLGDLRPEHVCLSDPPVVIDCLEFNQALRLVDPFDELAFLGMECARLQAPWIGPLLIERCGTLLDDAPPQRLLAFYTAYRACLRARLALAHLLDDEIRQPDKWQPQARTYLAIAERACLSLHPQGAPPATRSRDSAG